MTKRIFQSILAVSVVVLLASVTLIVGVLHGYFQSRVEEELASQTAYIAQGVEHLGKSYFDGLHTAARLTWVDTDGTVLYDNQEDPAAMGNHTDRAEIRQAMLSGHGSAVRYSDTLARNTVYYALRLTDGTVIRAAESQYSVWLLVLQAMQPVFFVVLLAVVLALWLSARVARQLVAPINDLDLGNLDGEACYEELTPLLGKLRSQQRQIQRQLDTLGRQQEEFAAITENMSEGLLVLDAETRVLSYNSAALHLLGAERPAEGREITAYELNREPGFRHCLEDALAGRRCERIVEQDEDCRQILANPVEENGAITGVVVVILDVTERERREALRREFTANVSHELKTPLTSILGTAEILAGGLVKPEDVGHFAGNIHREAQRLIALVNDIIHLSRLDESGPAADWEPVDLYAMAQSVLEQVRPAAERGQVSLTLQGGPAQVQGVPQIVEEILYNLCDNAVAYNQEDGSVTVTVEALSSGARVTVADTGIGIPREARNRIFERFYRVDKSHTSGGGTGLGLSIVKHGAAYLGAQVTLESQVGKGSTFTVTFP